MVWTLEALRGVSSCVGILILAIGLVPRSQGFCFLSCCWYGSAHAGSGSRMRFLCSGFFVFISPAGPPFAISAGMSDCGVTVDT